MEHPAGFESVSKQTLQRLPQYYAYLNMLPADGKTNISATAIAKALGLNQVQVRKDLAAVSAGGRPKTGYVIKDLMVDIARFLGYDDVNRAVIVGAGKLGKAMLTYQGFANYGLQVLAAFDCDRQALSEQSASKPILPMEELNAFCAGHSVHIGILTVPASQAQNACDALIQSGVLAIWNFAPVCLKVPEGILVQNENMAATLAILSNHLAEKLYYNKNKTSEKE